MPSPDLNIKIALWRQSALDGTITTEELREAIAALRGDRMGAAIASEKSKSTKAAKANKVVPSADDLLAELGDL